MIRPAPPRMVADGAGRIWRWHAELARRPGDPPGAFCHRWQVRTEQEIAHEAEPVIEVRDPRILAIRLEPVSAVRVVIRWDRCSCRSHTEIAEAGPRLLWDELAALLGEWEANSRTIPERWLAAATAEDGEAVR
ncbi:hypothetical protein [Saccharopolyspora hattusasensis]|uniref:hypothetical protein n=1 Tax=Saccharopolyspora hattusasensis TaxID=1128679 RepID=UPI003D977590